MQSPTMQLQPQSSEDIQRALDDMRVEMQMAADEDSPMQRYWRDVYRTCGLLDPEAHERDIRETATLGGVNRHRWVNNSEKVIYLMSVTNADRRTTAGTVCKASPRVAAECIVRSTHRLATTQQIAGHDALHKGRREEADKLRNRESSAAQQIADALSGALRERRPARQDEAGK